MRNIDIVRMICKALGKSESLINYVTDRKGHDLRYAIDPTKIHKELGWLPETKFADGIQKTIRWYLENRDWWEAIVNGGVSELLRAHVRGALERYVCAKKSWSRTTEGC